uniref:Uncharacterized protein n=1 Tax=Phytophthora fragariae TaxID=53985 RepID=A0A6A3DPD2_9STRA|nr:hypothetical protein PF009_g29462 [Phytophthora fragariae]
MDRNKKVGPDAWRAHREGSTAGEVSHYGTCRSGGIGLILRFVPLGKSPATSSSSGAGSSSSRNAGVDEAPPGRKPSWPLQHRHDDQQRRRRQQQHCRTRHSKMELVQASLIPGFVPLGKSPATSSSSGAGSSSSRNAGVDEAPPGRKPSWPLQHRHDDQQRRRRQQQHCRTRHSKMELVQAPPGRKPS